MHNNLLFSVIVPTYNRADLLNRCLESLVKQTFKNFEVIICDDGSTDNTEQVCIAYKNKLNIYYNSDVNWGGPARPRNRGISLAKGEYICFLDADDWWKPEKLEVLLRNLKNGADVFYHSLTIVNDGKELGNIKCRQVNNRIPGIDLLINLNTIPTSSACIRASYLKKVDGFAEDLSLIALEDYDLWIRLGLAGARFYLIKENLGFYHINNKDSITLADERQINKFDYLYSLYIYKPDLQQFKGRITAASYFQKGRILHDGRCGKFGQSYFKAFLGGTFRVKLMVLNRIRRILA